jgi:Tol biopolymer transport system component
VPDPAAPPGRIVFMRMLPPSARKVFRMDATGANATQLANGYAPALSPDGSRIAYNCGANICVMGDDGSGNVQLTTNVLAEAATWSSDGSRIAFHMQDPTGNWDMEVP